MASAAQVAANRANARRSTGPKTPAGKARSALNSLTHGFRSRVIFERASRRDSAAYAAFLESLVALLQPVGPLESQCVETMALADWRKRLVIQKEFDLQEEPDPNVPPFVDRTIFDIPFGQLEAPPAAASVMPPLPPPVALPCPASLLPLVRYEARLTREHRTAYRLLCALQSQRLGPDGDKLPPSGPAPLSPSPSPAPTAPNEPNPVPHSSHLERLSPISSLPDPLSFGPNGLTSGSSPAAGGIAAPPQPSPRPSGLPPDISPATGPVPISAAYPLPPSSILVPNEPNPSTPASPPSKALAPTYRIGLSASHPLTPGIGLCPQGTFWSAFHPLASSTLVPNEPSPLRNPPYLVHPDQSLAPFALPPAPLSRPC